MEMGKLCGSAQNYAFRGKLWSLVIRYISNLSLICFTVACLPLNVVVARHSEVVSHPSDPTYSKQ